MAELEYQNKFIEHHQYFLDRASNYPDITVLVNSLWEAMDNSEIPGKGTNFYNMIKEVKDRKSTRLNSSHVSESRMPSSA